MSQMVTGEVLKNSSTQKSNNGKAQKFQYAPKNGKPLNYFNNSQQKFLSQLKPPSYRAIRPKIKENYSLWQQQVNQQSQLISLGKILNNDHCLGVRKSEAPKIPQNQKVGDKYMISSRMNLQRPDRCLSIRPHLITESSRRSKFEKRIEDMQRKNASLSISEPLFNQPQINRYLYFNDDMQNLKLKNEHLEKSTIFGHQSPELYRTQIFAPEVTLLKQKQVASNDISNFFSETGNKLLNNEKYENLVTLKKCNDTGYYIIGHRSSMKCDNNSKLDSETMRASTYFSNNKNSVNRKLQDDSLLLKGNKEGNKFNQHLSNFDLSTKPKTCQISSTRKYIPIHIPHTKQYEINPRETVILSQKNKLNINQNANSHNRCVLLNDNYSPFQLVNQNKEVAYKITDNSRSVKLYPQSNFRCKIDHSKLKSRSETLQSLINQCSDQNKNDDLNCQYPIEYRNNFHSYLEHSQECNMNNKKRKVLADEVSLIGKRKIALEGNTYIPHISTAMPEVDKEIKCKKVKFNTSTDDTTFLNENLDNVYTSNSKLCGINKNTFNSGKCITSMPNLKSNIIPKLNTEENRLFYECQENHSCTSHHNVFPEESNRTTLNKKISNQEQKINPNSSQIIVNFPKDLQTELQPNSTVVVELASNDIKGIKKLYKVADTNKEQRNKELNKLISMGNRNKHNICHKNGISDRKIDDASSDLKCIYKTGIQPVKLQSMANKKCKNFVSTIQEEHEINRQESENEKSSMLDEKLPSILTQKDNGCCSIKGLFSNTENSKRSERANIECVISKPELKEKGENVSQIINRGNTKTSTKLQNMVNRNLQKLTEASANNMCEQSITAENVKTIKTYSQVSPIINIIPEYENHSSQHHSSQKSPKMLQYKSACLDNKAEFEKNTNSKCTVKKSSRDRKRSSKLGPTQISVKHNSDDFAEALQKYSNKWSKQIQQQILELKRIRLMYWLHLSLKKDVEPDDFKGNVEENAFEVLVKHVAGDL